MVLKLLGSHLISATSTVDSGGSKSTQKNFTLTRTDRMFFLKKKKIVNAGE